jgi:hypothetical protein
MIVIAALVIGLIVYFVTYGKYYVWIFSNMELLISY